MLFREIDKGDHLFVSILLQTAYERPEEARLVEELRASGEMALELVAEDRGQVMGHIAFVSLVEPARWWALAPVTVVSEHRNKGIGGELIRQGLDHARRGKTEAVVVVGDPRYYRRFGFSTKAAEQLNTVYPKDFTSLFPVTPGLTGAGEQLIYPRAFQKL